MEKIDVTLTREDWARLQLIKRAYRLDKSTALRFSLFLWHAVIELRSRQRIIRSGENILELLDPQEYPTGKISKFIRSFRKLDQPHKKININLEEEGFVKFADLATKEGIGSFNDGVKKALLVAERYIQAETTERVNPKKPLTVEIDKQRHELDIFTLFLPTSEEEEVDSEEESLDDEENWGDDDSEDDD